MRAGCQQWAHGNPASGHGLQLRVVGNPLGRFLSSDCTPCSHGDLYWGRFVALHLCLHEGDPVTLVGGDAVAANSPILCCLWV